ncbi:MAG: phosphate/phosphite/phosphonate ABC transporter substrate-binding protein [Yoonia sp.]|uniref:phosphate/phosphite/phosphonate ABC transporter substrate-binding protein n=1 Tax=Yoonia sp. TaxID=2212373 RepID=UPI003EF32438
MYARPGNAAAHAALWTLIRDHLRAGGIAAPDRLNCHIAPMDGWAHPDLVLGQICNLPLRKLFIDKVTVIGAADYGLAGCPAGYYRSHFVVRKDSPFRDPIALTDARFAYSEVLSQSGYGAAQLWAAARGAQFRPTLQTGSHKASIAAVAEGRADIASIDAQTWWIETRENPYIRELDIIGHTDPSPGMSFITRKGQDPAPYFAAIRDAIRALPSADAATLGLQSIVALDESAYDLPFPPEIHANCD